MILSMSSCKERSLIKRLKMLDGEKKMGYDWGKFVNADKWGLLIWLCLLVLITVMHTMSGFAWVIGTYVWLELVEKKGSAQK